MKNQCSTLGDIKQILKDLIAENNPLDKDLIEFYTKKVQTETEKALRKIDVKKMLLSK